MTGRDQTKIKPWLAEKLGPTATEILGRLRAMHPERFTDKQAQTVQRAIKPWHASEGAEIGVDPPPQAADRDRAPGLGAFGALNAPAPLQHDHPRRRDPPRRP